MMCSIHKQGRQQETRNIGNNNQVSYKSSAQAVASLAWYNTRYTLYISSEKVCCSYIDGRGIILTNNWWGFCLKVVYTLIKFPKNFFHQICKLLCKYFKLSLLSNMLKQKYYEKLCKSCTSSSILR